LTELPLTDSKPQPEKAAAEGKEREITSLHLHLALKIEGSAEYRSQHSYSGGHVVFPVQERFDGVSIHRIGATGYPSSVYSYKLSRRIT